VSIIDFTQYQPPGVYIEQLAVPLVGVTGIAPDIVGIVGPSNGYRTITESYVLNDVTPVTLNQYGANPATIIVSNQAGVPYLLTDYTVTVIEGNDPTGALNQVQLARAPVSNIPTGWAVYVNYQFTDQNYFLPVTYTDYPSVKKDWGAPLDLSTNAILSPLSLAAQLAFTNGANTILICPTADTGLVASRSGLSDAYQNLAAVEALDIIVPLPVGIVGTPALPGDTINIGLDLASFLTQQAQVGIFGVGLVGYDAANSVSPDVIAQGIGSYRIQEHWPNQMNYFNGTNNASFIISGYYLAAAWAGVMASLQRQIPLTKKNVSGLSGIPNTVFTTMSAAYKNQLSSSGVAVTEQVTGGGLQMRHSVSTSTTAVTTREISIIRAGDGMIEMIQNTLENSGLIGSAFTPNTLANIKSLVQGALEALVAQNTIVGYVNLGVQQQSNQPLVVLVQFQYQPAYPLNYIVVQYAIDVTTGSVSTVTTAPDPTGGSTGTTG
jgi:hypothetical protein